MMFQEPNTRAMNAAKRSRCLRILLFTWTRIAMINGHTNVPHVTRDSRVSYLTLLRNFFDDRLSTSYLLLFYINGSAATFDSFEHRLVDTKYWKITTNSVSLLMWPQWSTSPVMCPDTQDFNQRCGFEMGLEQSKRKTHSITQRLPISEIYLGIPPLSMW